jgi:hypothetical protein
MQTPKESRFCGHCGKPLRHWNKSGYCFAHLYPYQRMERRFCQEPGCKNKKPLRSDCKTGFCMAHRFRLQLSERKVCKEEGCKKRLGGRNQCGYCPKHRKKYFAEQDRLAAAKRSADLRVKAAAADEAKRMVLDLRAEVDAAKQAVTEKEANLADLKAKAAADHILAQQGQQQLPTAAKATRGAKKKTEASKEYFRVGNLVQEKLTSLKDVTAARLVVAKNEGLKYQTVVRYHKMFRNKHLLAPVIEMRA